VDESGAHRESDELLINQAKNRFYDELYEERFKKMTNSTLITQERYNTIVKVLLARRSRQKGQQMPKFDRDCLKKYILVGNIANKCLYRKADYGHHLSIVTYEDVFDVIYNNHERSIKKS
jgi:hypothetical protein